MAEDTLDDDPTYGDLIRSLSHAENSEALSQQLAVDKAALFRLACQNEEHCASLDKTVLPSLLTEAATVLHGHFREALLEAVPNCRDGIKDRKKEGDEKEGDDDDNDDNDSDDDDENDDDDDDGGFAGQFRARSLSLLMGPVKKMARVGEKIDVYREERGNGNWPYSAFVVDILRATYVCGTAEDMSRVYDGLCASKAFTVARLKNKLAKGKPPFNQHINLIFHHHSCIDFVTEIQLHFWPVYSLQKSQHLAYELRRASALQNIAQESQD